MAAIRVHQAFLTAPAADPPRLRIQQAYLTAPSDPSDLPALRVHQAYLTATAADGIAYSTNAAGTAWGADQVWFTNGAAWTREA